MDKTTKIDINLKGHWYNHWPWLKISHNNQIIWHGQVTDSLILNFDLVCDEHNCLEFEHHGKQFGENGIWDTATDGSADCKLQIQDICFDDVSIGHKLRANLKFLSNPTEQQKQDSQWMKTFAVIDNCDGWMNFNGMIGFCYEWPVYDWLIVNKFRIDQTHSQAYFSGYSSRWHYDEDIKLIAEIKNLMKLDENCGNSNTTA